MIKYITETFEINDDDVLWDKFMGFMRQIVPWKEEQLIQLSAIQKIPVIAFIYSSEVMGDGHNQFLDLYGAYIKKEDIVDSFNTLSIPKEYIENIEKIPSVFMSVTGLKENDLGEEKREKEMKRIDEICDECDSLFYQYGNEQVDEKIIEYVRKYHLDFFEFK